MERGFTSVVSPEDFKGWVVGFYNEQSDELAKLPEMLADSDAQVARWQSKYGRDPTDQQRSWLVNKIRTDIAMIGTAQRPSHHQEPPVTDHAREVTSAHGSARENGTGISGLGPPACKAGDHTRVDQKAA